MFFRTKLYKFIIYLTSFSEEKLQFIINIILYIDGKNKVELVSNLHFISFSYIKTSQIHHQSPNSLFKALFTTI